MKWIWCRFGLELCLLWICMRVADEKDVDLLVESEWWDSRRESGKEWVGVKRERKERKRCLREMSIFLLFFCDYVFHIILSPHFIHTITPFLHSHPPTTPHKHAYVLPSFFVTVCPLIPHTIKQHKITKSDAT